MSEPDAPDQNAQPQHKPGASGALSALNKLRLPLQVGKGAQLAGGLLKAKVLIWVAAAAAIVLLVGLLFLLVVGMAGAASGGTIRTNCESEATAATLAPGGGIIVGASEYGGPGDPNTKGDKGAFGELDGKMAYAELGLSGSGWQTAQKIGDALGLGKALPPNTKLQITANGRSVIAEKLDDGLGGQPVGSPPHERVIDLWYQTAAALGLDSTDSGQWSGLVRIQLIQSPSTTPVSQTESQTAIASQSTGPSTQALGTQAAIAYAQDQQASPVGFAVANSNGEIIASYNPHATDYGRSITESMLLVAYLRQNASQPLSAAARTNLSAMIEQSANGNEGPGADWVYHHLHNPNAQIEQVAHDAGMSDFHLNTSDPAYVLSRSLLSAADMALMFSKIRQLMPASLQAYGMSLLLNIATDNPGHAGIYGSGVTGGPIYSKSGWEQETNGRYTFNQAALITVASQQYAVAVITANNPSYSVGEGIVQGIATYLFQPLIVGSGASAAEAGGECPESAPTEENGNLGAEIVQIAQSQLGQGENPPESNCTIYGGCEPWCSDFLTWVWQHAGIGIPRLPYSGKVSEWGEVHSKVLPPTATPAPGDAVEFGWGPKSSEHVGIVEQVFPNGEITMISGNWGNEVARSQPFQPAQAQKTSGSGFPIYAYVVP